MDADEARWKWFPLVDNVIYLAMSTRFTVECERVLFTKSKYVLISVDELQVSTSL